MCFNMFNDMLMLNIYIYMFIIKVHIYICLHTCVYLCLFPVIIIIMVIFKCYFSGEHIVLSIKKTKKQQRCEHRIRKNQHIKSTVHDAN